MKEVRKKVEKFQLELGGFRTSAPTMSRGESKSIDLSENQIFKTNDQRLKTNDQRLKTKTSKECLEIQHVGAL